MYMATWLTGKRERVRSFAYGLAQFGVLMGVLVWLLMLEPDLGTSVLLVTIGAAMFFVCRRAQGSHAVRRHDADRRCSVHGTGTLRLLPS